MEDEELVELIQDLNPWWQTGEVELPDYIIKRDGRETFENLKDTGNILGVIGLRRVGKTTFLKQTIDRFENPKRSCYFSFDLEDISVKQLVEVFCEDILGEPLSELKGEVQFFLDEVQNLENWSREVKHFYDNYENLRFTVTGSSAVNLVKGAGESLAGRFSTLRLRPFSFEEYLRYEGVDTPGVSLADDTLPDSSRKFRVEFTNYLGDGGMPELYRVSQGKERLEEVIDLVFFRDVVELFDVGRPELLGNIFKVLGENTGQKVNFSNISNSLDSDFRTVKQYVDYLEDSFLISKSKLFRKSEMARQRKNPKVYVADHSYANLYGAQEGLVAETVAFNHLKRVEEPQHTSDPEVDVVLPEHGLAFEVKYKENISDKIVSRVADFAEEEDLEPFVVTKNSFDKRTANNQEVRLVPLWFLCLAVSNI